VAIVHHPFGLMIFLAAMAEAAPLKNAHVFPIVWTRLGDATIDFLMGM